MFYSELSVEEHAAIQIGHAQGLSQRKITRLINRPPPFDHQPKVAPQSR